MKIYRVKFANMNIGGDHTFSEYIVDEKLSHAEIVIMLEEDIGTIIGEINKFGGKVLDICCIRSGVAFYTCDCNY